MDESVKDSCLRAHNEYRALHEGTPSMVWSDKLAEQAQDWADHIAQLGTMKHSSAKDRKGQGENLACCKGKTSLIVIINPTKGGLFWVHSMVGGGSI